MNSSQLYQIYLNFECIINFLLYEPATTDAETGNNTSFPPSRHTGIPRIEQAKQFARDIERLLGLG
jgi:hypothetical protein